jgi:hypothetical protein
MRLERSVLNTKSRIGLVALTVLGVERSVLSAESRKRLVALTTLRVELFARSLAIAGARLCSHTRNFCIGQRRLGARQSGCHISCGSLGAGDRGSSGSCGFNASAFLLLQQFFCRRLRRSKSCTQGGCIGPRGVVFNTQRGFRIAGHILGCLGSVLGSSQFRPHGGELVRERRTTSRFSFQGSGCCCEMTSGRRRLRSERDTGSSRITRGGHGHRSSSSCGNGSGSAGLR